MNFELQSTGLTGLATEKCDVLLVLVPDSFKPGRDGVSGLIARATASGDFAAKAGSSLAHYKPAGLLATRLVLVGVGDGSARRVKAGVAGVWGSLKAAQAKHLTVAFASAATAETLRAAVQAVADSSYVYTTTKSKADGRSLKKVTLAVSNGDALRDDFERATAIVSGVELAKEWANRPANYATPTMLGKVAATLADHGKISCDVLGPKEVEKLGMGSFLAVAKGSSEPLRFIVLKYQGAARGVAPHVLVGKGITFDSGGISIKPAPEMDEMKYDMSGAASVLGVFKTLSILKPRINVVGLIPACENLPSSRAVKPGDVVTSMSGQTIEILNTDAEGRLVLCDALTYAERFKPQAVIDIATLTGACVIALGAVRSGLFSANEGLAKQLVVAGETAQDLCWPMPLDEEYAEGLKTHFADVANVAGRAAGSVTAAKFLQRFTQKFPWAHLDIAGTAWKSGAAKGATGRPVGLLVEYLLARAAGSSSSHAG